jgi:hypothetical protein
MLPLQQATIVAHQIYFHKTRSLLIPLTKSAQRNLFLQKRSRFGSGASAQLMLLSFRT